MSIQISNQKSLANIFVKTEYKTDETTSICRDYVSSLFSTINRVGNYIFVPDEKPTWKGTLVKTGVGFIGLFGIDKFSNENKTHYKIDPMLYMSTGLFMTGIREACYLAYTNIAYPLFSQSNKGDINKIKKCSRIIEQKDRELVKILKVMKLILFSGISLHCLYNYDTLGNIKFFSRSNVNFSHVNSLDFISKNDFTLAIFQLGACIANLAINLHELKHFDQDAFLSYNPMLEIFNVSVFASFISQMGRIRPEARAYHICINKNGETLGDRWNDNDIDNVIKFCINLLPPEKGVRTEILKEYGIAVRTTLNYTSAFFSYAKLYTIQTLSLNIFSLLKKNINNYWKINPKITKEDISINMEDKIKQKFHPIIYFPKVEKDEHPVTCNNIDNKHISPELPQISEESNILREKKKTKGPANKLQSSLKVKTANSQNLSNLELSNKKIRETALKRIKDLRKQHPIKVLAIQYELKQAEKFLNGRIVPVDGSEFSLEWTIGKNRFAMNYEIPHGKDATNYKGNKLNRVLSVLETCYLVGLSEELANKYIERYNLYNLYRLQKFIYYIFLHKKTDR